MHLETSKLLRALRKHYGLYQSTFAEYLSTTQGTLSKLEAGQLELSATQWVSICLRFNLNPKSLMTGIIESLDSSKLELTSQNKIGTFKIPKSYSYLMGSTVRSATPLLKFMKAHIGEEKTNAFITHHGFDLDFFTIQSHPLSLKFIEAITLELMNQNLISQGNIQNILKDTSNENTHEYVLSSIKQSKNKEVVFKQFTNQINNFFEINSRYEYVGDDDCHIKAIDADHVKDLSLSDQFKSFREEFNLSHFNKLSTDLDLPKNLITQKVDNGWLLRAS